MTDNAERIARIRREYEFFGELPEEEDCIWLIQQAESIAGAKVVAKVVINDAGQINMKDANGGYFNMSKYVGETFYTLPQPACGNENQGEKK